MSKDEVNCKLTSVYKHKERKPKKPHYIPRPWGKPYNYKCFQCPFTCMEKSHLYNHMKYSLCKNSLSLLIESDWPYKKGNLLHPELRLLQATEASRLRGRRHEQEACDSTAAAEPDFIITDVFSLKNHATKGKEMAPPELEAKPKHCKGPKKCLGSGGVLMEQWKLVANGQRRGTTEVSSPCAEGNIIPCYPPPAYSDYHEPQGLNLSLLGINYPLNPGLFSYLGPSMANSTTPHPQLAQLPFLASTTQLMHPHSAHFQPLQTPERSAFLPRFYYPLLFEHTFSSAESKTVSGKAEAQAPAGSAMPAATQAKTPNEPPKAGLLKVPVGSDVLSPVITASDHPLCKQNKVHRTSTSRTDPEATTVLIGDLSKTLEEYQEVEKKLSDLAKEDTPGQKQLREQLVKIRRELYHIHQALENATKPHEGPLDLSVKRSQEGPEMGHQAKKEPCKANLEDERLQCKEQGCSGPQTFEGHAPLPPACAPPFPWSQGQEWSCGSGWRGEEGHIHRWGKGAKAGDGSGDGARGAGTIFIVGVLRAIEPNCKPCM
uniref:Proline rich 35 n=1 Tax=Chrysemys picta bellii TaxID=8478 RepID=A0A8C3PDZ6_CHRPI